MLAFWWHAMLGLHAAGEVADRACCFVTVRPSFLRDCSAACILFFIIVILPRLCSLLLVTVSGSGSNAS